jgi:ribulose-5-phosphate 4-epimerase/fuculose-1-phosphate aldolase
VGSARSACRRISHGGPLRLEDHFPINLYGYRFDEVCASNLVKVDHQGSIVGGLNREISPSGFVIHSAIQMARPDVQRVMHGHTVAGTAVAALRQGLLPIGMYSFGCFERAGHG